MKKYFLLGMCLTIATVAMCQSTYRNARIHITPASTISYSFGDVTLSDDGGGIIDAQILNGKPFFVRNPQDGFTASKISQPNQEWNSCDVPVQGE